MLLKKILFCILFQLLLLHNFAQTAEVKIHYLGHSAFLLLFDDESSVLCDYGDENAWAENGWNSPIYDIGNLQPTVITYSHLHEYHFAPRRINSQNSFIYIGDSAQIGKLSMRSIPTSEDDLSKRSNNSILFSYKGITILHLGDCQANIFYIESLNNQKYLKQSFPKGCDIMLIPIENKYQFIKEAEKFVDLLQPKIVIPMHYWHQDYKRQFLHYMDTITNSGTPKYNVEEFDGAQFKYPLKNRNSRTTVVNVKPAPYRQ